jgi:hypothetical protein
MPEFYSNGRHVPIGNGWKWIADGWTLFMRAPGMWIGVTALWALLWLAISSVPIIGWFAAPVVNIIFAGGLALGCRALEEGGALKVEHLFAGFQERVGTLTGVGFLYFAAILVATLAAILSVGFRVWELLLSAPLDVEGVLTLIYYTALGVLIFAALMLPALMAVWFAPCLVALRHVGVVDSIRASFAGCLRNVLPFLVYGLVLLIPAIFATISILGWLLLWPLVVTSTYAAYKDIYTG